MPISPTGTLDELAWLGIAELGPLLRRKEISVVELVRSVLARIEKLQPRCHAFLLTTPELALVQAAQADAELASGQDRGPLHGVPYALKDLANVAGLPTTCHSLILAGNVAATDAEVVKRLRHAGAVLVGKTSLHEFATGGPAFDLPWPPARNPWDLSRHPGGSSSGSGVAVAAGLVPGAVGTDTGGSIRNPAACCGLVGLKPTHGLVSEKGVFPLSSTLDHVGPMTRTVEDNALLLQAMTGSAPFDPAMRKGIRGLRIGVVEQFGDANVDATIVKAFDEAVALLGSMGAGIRVAKLPPLAEWAECGRTIQQFEQYAVHRKWLTERPQDYCAINRTKLAAGANLQREDYEQALGRRRELRAALESVMDSFDALVSLSSFHLPALIEDAEAVAKTYTRHARMPFNVSGTPAIAVPTGFSADGLPLGMQFRAKVHDESMLSRIAWAYCEETLAATSWRTRHPQLG